MRKAEEIIQSKADYGREWVHVRHYVKRKSYKKELTKRRIQ